MTYNSKISKKIISSLVALIMVFSVAGNIFAAQVNVTNVDTSNGESEQRANVGIDYLGGGNAPATSAQELPDPSTLVSGNYLWVGVYLSDLKKMAESNTTDDGGTVFQNNAKTRGGLYNVTISVEYAAKYLRYYANTASNQMTYLSNLSGANQGWNEQYVTNQEDVDNYGDEPIYDNKSSLYTATVSNRASVSVTGRETAVIKTDDTPNSVSVQIMVANGTPDKNQILFSDLNNDKLYVAVIGFRVANTATAANPIPSGTKLVTTGLNAADFTLSTGNIMDTLWTAAWHTDRSNTSAGNLKNYFDYDGDLDFVPASSNDVYDSLVKTGTLTKGLGDYISGQKFDPSGLTFTPHYSESGNKDDEALVPTDSDYKGITFYVGAENLSTADITADMAKTDPETPSGKVLTASTELSTTDNDKHVYALVKKGNVWQSVDLGAITVAAQSVSSISITTNTTGDHATTFGTKPPYYNTAKIKDVLTRETNPDTLVVEITYNNGKKDYVSYKDFASKGLELYRKPNPDNYLPVGDNDYFTAGPAVGSNTQQFWVALTSEVEDNDVANATHKVSFEVPVTADTTTIQSKSGNTKLKYGAGYPITLDGLSLVTKDASKSTNNQSKTVSELDNTILYYYVDPASEDVTYATNQANAIVPGTTKYAPTAMNGKKIYAVPANNTSATPIEIGTISNRAVAEATTGNIFEAANTSGLTYGDTLDKVLYKSSSDLQNPGIGANITVNYDNGDVETFTWNNTKKNFIKAQDGDKPELTLLGSGTGNEGVTMQYKNADATYQTVLQPGTADKIVFKKGNTTILESAALTVGKKTAKINVAPPTSAPPTKSYDGGTDLPTNATVGTFTFGDTIADDAAVLEKVEMDGLTFKYNSKSAGNDKKIEVTGTPSIKAKAGGATPDELADLNSKYNFVLGTGFETDASNKTTVSGLAGVINKKSLKVKTVPKLTGSYTIEVGQTTDLTGEYTLALTTENTDDTDGLVNGDSVNVKFNYSYQGANVSQAGDVTVATSDYLLTGADKDNYTLDEEHFPTVTGTVQNKQLDRVEVVPNNDKKVFTYPDNKLDLSGWKVKIHYQGAAAPTEMTIAEYLADNGSITFTNNGANVTLNSTNVDKATDGSITLGYGDIPMTFTWDGNTGEGKQGAATITGKKKPISLSDITFQPSKVYGESDEDANKNYTVPEGNYANQDGTKINVGYDVEFTDTDAGEGNRKAIVKNITLSAKEGDTTNAYQNYEIVDSNGQPITNATTVELTNATISNAAQTAPAEPDVTVDPGTNNIIVNGPLGENIEYSIDGQNWQSEPLFTDLDPDKTYSVQARQKSKTNYEASPASTTRTTTFKYHVRAFKKNADIATATPVAEIYTNTQSATSDSDMNTNVFTKKPSKWKAYYTDAAATEKIEYPYTLKTETVLYMTQSSGSSGGGGGGGGTSSYTVKFNAATNGKITEGKTSVSVNSGASVTADQIPTVTANDGYRFIGWSTDGKEVVDPTTVAVKKATTFTALYEEGTEEPTPAPTAEPAPTTEPTPTDKPTPTRRPSSGGLINPDYMNPYASGYEDNSFRPGNDITRAELATMVARLINEGDLPDGAYLSTFSDINNDEWFSKYVGYLEDKDVLSGYEDGTFRPANPVTRGEIAAVITRAQQLDLVPYTGIFTDVTDSDWAKDFIQTLADNGIAAGYEDGTFGPYSPITRAETVTMINKVLAPSQPIADFVPNDIAGHWAENQVMLAVNFRELLDSAAPAAE